MTNYITSIKDLVIQVLTNGKEIKGKAKENDPTSCFQMGMVHLLGINTQIDFKEASSFFANQSLADNLEANRLLGLIAEFEGNYSLAFDYYAKAKTESDQVSYYRMVYEEREELRSFIKKVKLPERALNNVITTVLEEYNKKDSKLCASIKLAVICNDKQSYMEVAQNFCDDGDYSSAIYWLKKADANLASPLYTTILNKIQEYSISLKESKTIQPLEIGGNSLLLDFDISTTFAAAMKALNEIPSLCRDLWRKGVAKKVKQIKDKWEKEEKSKKEREKAEHNAFLKQQEEEEAARKKKKKRENTIALVAIVIFLCIMGVIMPSSTKQNGDAEESAKEEYVLTGKKKLYGSVDKYPITMELQIEDKVVKGTYYYDKQGPDNVLYLSGVVNNQEIDIYESTENGQQTGHFHGYYSDGVFQGDFISQKGKHLSFKVSE